MNETLIIISAFLFAGTLATAIGGIIAMLLILQANQKMYTEYFKDRSMNNRFKED